MRTSFFYLVSLLFLNACSHHHNHLTYQPINVELNDGKWLIDEPLLVRVESYFESVTVDYYRKILKNKFSDFNYISDFQQFSTLNKALSRDTKSLKLYKLRTHCDYLISTKLELVPSEFPSMRNFSVIIIVYDLNSETLVFKNEYHSYKKIKSANSYLVKKFIDLSIKVAISDFSKNENWKYFSTNK